MTLEELSALNRPLTEDEFEFVLEMLLENVERIGVNLKSMSSRVRKKPLIGGPYGTGRFVLASHTYVLGGLDRIHYYVLEERSWLAVGSGDSVREALEKARNFFPLVKPARLALFIEAAVIRRHTEAKEQEKARKKAHEEWLETASSKPASRVKSIPRRRRQIFDASAGKCHYCGEVLALDGKWHIEHKMPKALMGGNEPSNLVASCVSCNHKKRDKTDLEFIAQRSQA